MKRDFRREFGVSGSSSRIPSIFTIDRIVKKLYTKGVLIAQSRKGEPHRSDKHNRIEVVRNVNGRNPKTSVRKCSQEIGISKTQVQRILASELKLYPYKLQMLQALKE